MLIRVIDFVDINHVPPRGYTGFYPVEIVKAQIGTVQLVHLLSGSHIPCAFPFSPRPGSSINGLPEAVLVKCKVTFRFKGSRKQMTKTVRSAYRFTNGEPDPAPRPLVVQGKVKALDSLIDSLDKHGIAVDGLWVDDSDTGTTYWHRRRKNLK